MTFKTVGNTKLRRSTYSLLHAGFLLDSFTTTQIEAVCSSEIWVNFHRPAWHYVPEDISLHN
jgi:hypothetical protein